MLATHTDVCRHLSYRKQFRFLEHLYSTNCIRVYREVWRIPRTNLEILRNSAVFWSFLRTFEEFSLTLSPSDFLICMLFKRFEGGLRAKGLTFINLYSVEMCAIPQEQNKVAKWGIPKLDVHPDAVRTVTSSCLF